MRMCVASVLARNFSALVDVAYFALIYFTIRVYGKCPAGLFAIDFFSVHLLTFIYLFIFFSLKHFFSFIIYTFILLGFGNRIVCPFCTRVVRQLRIAKREQGGAGQRVDYAHIHAPHWLSEWAQNFWFVYLRIHVSVNKWLVNHNQTVRTIIYRPDVELYKESLVEN